MEILITAVVFAALGYAFAKGYLDAPVAWWINKVKGWTK